MIFRETESILDRQTKEGKSATSVGSGNSDKTQNMTITLPGKPGYRVLHGK